MVDVGGLLESLLKCGGFVKKFGFVGFFGGLMMFKVECLDFLCCCSMYVIMDNEGGYIINGEEVVMVDFECEVCCVVCKVCWME